MSPIPCFVVSLIRAKDRRAAIEQALSGLKIPFIFFDAIDAANGLPPEFSARVQPHPEHPLGPREYACALSHANVYRHIVDCDIEHALILEDDAIPMPDLKTFLNKACYKRRSLFQLYHNAAYVHRFGKLTLFDSVVARPLAMSCSGTVAYTINQQAARALLKATEPVRFKADWPLDLSELGACITQPVLVQHPEDRSQSEIARDRQRKRRSARRYLSSAYYQRKWRRLLAQRVRSARAP
ncbi:MAG: glycosyltransferase family 25 protein [Granulosicoccus sp.]|nr:glycosyltransferase family 25 protein [Granulosicoccus sp.]